MRGTGGGAGCVEAVKAAIGLDDSGLRVKWRMQVRKAFGECRRAFIEDEMLFAHWLLFGVLRLHKISIHLGTAVTEELPGFAHLGDFIEVEIGGENFIFVA